MPLIQSFSSKATSLLVKWRRRFNADPYIHFSLGIMSAHFANFLLHFFISRKVLPSFKRRPLPPAPLLIPGSATNLICKEGITALLARRRNWFVTTTKVSLTTINYLVNYTSPDDRDQLTTIDNRYHHNRATFLSPLTANEYSHSE